jgi:hypothetical protein
VLDRAAVHIGQEPALAPGTVVHLVHQLSPQVRAHVVERAGVPHARGHPMLDMVVAQRDVTPLGGHQLVEIEHRAAVLRAGSIEGEDALDLAVQHQHAAPLVPLGPKHRPLGAHQRLVRHREHAQVQCRIHEPARLVTGHIHAQLFEQPQDGAGLGGAGSIVIAGDENDWRAWERLAKPLKLVEREDDGGVGGSNRVEQVAGHDHGVGAGLDDTIHRHAKGVGDIGLALVDAGRGLPMVLPNAEVRVGDVGQFHP